MQQGEWKFIMRVLLCNNHTAKINVLRIQGPWAALFLTSVMSHTLFFITPILYVPIRSPYICYFIILGPWVKHCDGGGGGGGGLIWWKTGMFLGIFLAIQIVLFHSVNFHKIMQHLGNICLNFYCRILKIERVTVNLQRHLGKKSFCGAHHNSQQNHLKQKNQSAFVKGNVSRGNPRRIFFLFRLFNFA